MSQTLNCPACGAAVPSRLAHAKLLVCEQCQTSLFLEDEAVKNIGTKAALTDGPSLLQKGQRYQYRQWIFETYGRARFEYGDGDGYWDEWWVVLDSGEGRWLSVDEGDIAVESPLEFNATPPGYDQLEIGQDIKFADQTLTVTEKNRSACIALEGELPEIIAPGDIHEYVHLSGPSGLIITLEFYDGNFDVYKGVWIDPFEVKSLSQY